MADNKSGKGDKIANLLSFDPITNYINFLSLNKRQRLNYVSFFFGSPALTVRVFLRRKLGYRTLSTTKIFFTCLFIVYLPFIVDFIPHPRTLKADFQNSLIVFAVACYVIAYIQKWMRWNELGRGKFWHSYSEGISWFSFLPLSESICNRFIDPLICFIVGLIIAATFSDYLGGWLMFSAVSLYMVEIALHEARIEQLLDQIDGMCEAEASSKELSAMATREDEQGLTPKPISREETAGVPTGLAPDIEAQIQRRRARKPPPDELAPADDTAAA